jgi:hypothetical protein
MQQGKRVFTICARGSQQDLTTNGWNRTCSFRIAVTTLMVNEYLHQTGKDFRMKLPLGFWNEITLLIATPDNWGKVDCMQKYVTKVLQVQKLVTLTKRSKEL